MSDKLKEDAGIEPKKPSDEVGAGGAQLRRDVADALDETADIDRFFPEDLKGIVLALRHLDVPGYRLFMGYLKGTVKARDILTMEPKNESACSALYELRKFKDAHPKWQDVIDPEIPRWDQERLGAQEKKNAKKQSEFNQEIMRLTRTECPGMAINHRNPQAVPDQPVGYDSSLPLKIIFSGGTGDENTISVKTVQGVSVITAGTGPGAILRDGEKVVIGRSNLNLSDILGIPLKGQRSVAVQLSFGSKGVSRACLTLKRSADGNTIMIFDSGMVNKVSVIEGEQKIEYDPAMMQSYVGKAEKD